MKLSKTHLFWGAVYLACLFFVSRSLMPQIQSYFSTQSIIVKPNDDPSVANMHIGQELTIEKSDGQILLSTQPFTIVNKATGYTMSATPKQFEGSSGFVVDLRVPTNNVTIKVTEGNLVAVGLIADKENATATISSTTENWPVQLLYFPGLSNIFLLFYMMLATWKMLTDSPDMSYWGFAGFVGWVVPNFVLTNIKPEQYYLYAVVTIIAVLSTYIVTHVLKLFDFTSPRSVSS